jgi:Ca-activated chloride channel family protein
MLSRASTLVAAAVLAALPMVVAGPADAIGILVPSGGAQSLDLVYHRVEVNITERGAQTKVTQEFENKTGRQLEATYLFPLPTGATVDEFALWMNGKREVGKVMERNKARQIYESIVRRARDPGLIEYVDAELFQARVFPIPANGKQKVELVYSHVVDYDAGTHRYVYPMKTDAHATSTLNDFTLTVNIKSKLPIRNLYSPTHTIAGRAKGKTAIASFEKSGFSLADDFALYWQVADEDVGVTVLSTNEDADGAGYFMLLASPKDGFRDKEIIGKRVSFVVDTSGSMAGDKMDRTKAALDYCVSQLGGDDLFNVITFGGYVETFEERMVAASDRNKARAREFVKKIDPLGGTNIDEALTTALKGATGSDKAPHLVVFLTDGRPTIGETEPASILKNVAKDRQDARIFVFGVGDDVNTVLLDKLASEGGGTQMYIRDAGAIEGQIKSFYDKISHPVLSDLQLDISGVRTFGNHPRKLGHLFKGGQLVVLGRYRKGGKATVKLQGMTSKGKRTFSFDADFAKGATEHSFIPRLWAQRQVGMLLSEIREKGESRGLVDEVTQLATRFGIVTPYTSYLVVEPGFDTGRPMPEPVLRDRPMGTRGGGPGDDLGAFAPDMDEMDAEAAPSAAPQRKSGKADKSFGGARAKKDSRARRVMSESSGEGAVRAAEEIGRLKDAKSLDTRRVATTQERAMGRVFTWNGAFYVDETVKASDKTLHIKAYGQAFFDALRLRPDLKSALALGTSVKVRVGKGRTLIVSPDGQDSVDASQLSGFMKKR